MRKFFKKEEKLPFSYNAIEERKQKSNYFVWIIGIILIIILGVIISRFL